VSISTAFRRVCESLWTTVAAVLVTILVVGTSLASRPRSAHLPEAYVAGEEGIAGESLDRGREELARYLEKHPRDDYALRLLGVAFLNLEEEDKGIPYLEKSIRINPHQPGVARYLKNIGRDPGVVPCPGVAGATIRSGTPMEQRQSGGFPGQPAPAHKGSGMGWGR